MLKAQIFINILYLLQSVLSIDNLKINVYKKVKKVLPFAETL